MQLLRQTHKSTRTISAHYPNLNPFGKIGQLDTCPRNPTPTKVNRDTQMKRTVFVSGEIKLAENITVQTDECRRRTAKKYKRKIKKPRKQNIYMTRDK